jgi:hypothetical protein
MSKALLQDALQRTSSVGIESVLQLASTLRLTAAAIAIALAAGCALTKSVESTRLSAAPAEAPFATVLVLESAQLEEPILFWQAGQVVLARDVVVVYLRLAHPNRFVPKGIETPTVLLEELQTISLFPPLHPVWAIVAPRPTIALRDATLWVAPIGSNSTSKERSALLALLRSVQRTQAGDVLSLATAPAAALPGPTVMVRNQAALLAHALENANSLARRER